MEKPETYPQYEASTKKPAKAIVLSVACAICQEDILQYQEARLDCDHAFCTPCIKEWLRASSACPQCTEDTRTLRYRADGGLWRKEPIRKKKFRFVPSRGRNTGIRYAEEAEEAEEAFGRKRNCSPR